MSELQLPVKEETVHKHVEVAKILMVDVKKELKAQGLTFRQVVEWGLIQFLKESQRNKKQQLP